MELTLEEVKPIIKHIISQNRVIQEKGGLPVAVNISSNAGIGKSLLIEQIANELDCNFVKVNPSNMSEPGELLGYPQREYYICRDGECKWITQDLIEGFSKAGWTISEETRMSYAIPAWLKNFNTDKPNILLIDDWTRSSNVIIQSLYEIIYRQEYLSWKLPPNSHILLTSNPDNGDYVVTSIDEAASSRMVTFNVKFDANVWARYAQAEGIDSRCQNFLLLYYHELMNRKQGYSKVNARNYTMFANIISGIDDWSTLENQALILQIASGCFLDDSDIVGGLFTQFISNKLDKLIDPELLVTGSFDRVKRILLDQLYDEDLYRADIANVITTRFINFASNWIDQKKDIKVIIDRIVDIIDCDKQLLSEDLLFSLIKTLNTNHMGKCSKLILNPKIANKLMS